MFTTFRKFLFVAVSIALTSCSKPASESVTEEALTGLLPADTLAFGVIDCQNQDLKAWMTSPGYKKYVELNKQAMANPNPMVGDFSTYMAVAQELGFMSATEGVTDLPFGKSIYFASKGLDKAVALAGYYNTAPGKNAQDILGRIKKIISDKGVKVTDLSGAGFSGFTFEPFAGMAEVPAGMAVYRDSLGIKEIYLGASEKRLVVTTTRPLLDRGFAEAKKEAVAFVEGEQTKKALDAAGVSSKAPTYGVVDVAALARHTGATENDIALIPVNIVALGTEMTKSGMSMVLASIVEPKNAEQKEFVSNFPAPAKGSLYAKLPSTVALGISLDGPFIKKVFETAEKRAPSPEFGMFSELISKLKSVNIGIGASDGMTMIPEITITLLSDDAKGLLGKIKELSSMSPAGDAVTWQDTTVEGVPAYSIPTPLTRVQIAAIDDVVAASTNGSVLTNIVKKAKGYDLRDDSTVTDSSTLAKGLFAGSYLDYAGFAVLIENSLKSAAAFIPPGQSLPTEQLGAMKVLGKVTFGIGYESGVARISMVQRFPEAS